MCSAHLHCWPTHPCYPSPKVNSPHETLAPHPPPVSGDLDPHGPSELTTQGTSQMATDETWPLVWSVAFGRHPQVSSGCLGYWWQFIDGFDVSKDSSEVHRRQEDVHHQGAAKQSLCGSLQPLALPSSSGFKAAGGPVALHLPGPVCIPAWLFPVL